MVGGVIGSNEIRSHCLSIARGSLPIIAIVILSFIRFLLFLPSFLLFLFDRQFDVTDTFVGISVQSIAPSLS